MAPVQDDVVRAAAILNAGRKIAILAGQGASDARLHLLQTAELLGAPIAKALLGKAILPDDHPYVTGGVGYLGARPSQQVFAECDTLLIVGSTFPYIEYYPNRKTYAACRSTSIRRGSACDSRSKRELSAIPLKRSAR